MRFQTKCEGCVRNKKLILHFKARTDDSHATPSISHLNCSKYRLTYSRETVTLVRLCVDHRIKPHIPPFKQIPANSVKFRSRDRCPQAEYFSVNFNLNRYNTHCSRYRLIGSLILFSICTFMYQCQKNVVKYFHIWKSSSNPCI